MKKKLLIALTLTLIVGGVLLTGNNIENNKNKFLSKYDLQDMSIAELVTYMDSSAPKPEGLQAQVSQNNLVLTDGNEEHIYKIDNDLFYVSISPYTTNTHPCFDHIPTGCQGEMINTEFEVEVKYDFGTVVYADTVRTAVNGFAGIWLPKNVSGTITVKYDDKVATSDIGTYSTDRSCLTTLELI